MQQQTIYLMLEKAILLVLISVRVFNLYVVTINQCQYIKFATTILKTRITDIAVHVSINLHTSNKLR